MILLVISYWLPWLSDHCAGWLAHLLAISAILSLTVIESDLQSYFSINPSFYRSLS